MSGFVFWLLIVVCVVALVILFFPFKFKIEFEAGEHGGWAHFFFFKKNFWNYEKKWGKEEPEEETPDDGDSMPTFVATAPKPKVEAKPAPAEKNSATAFKAEQKPAMEPVTSKPADVKPAESKPFESKPAASASATDPATSKPVESKPATSTSAAKSADSKMAAEPVASKPADAKPLESKPAASASAAEPATKTKSKEKKEKPEKRKLTDTEFWTILLTPDLDARAYRYVKRALAALLKLFRLKFHECFVEGIRADYKTMGYGAAANGIIKSFPVLCDWDIRMDWCGDKRLRAAGTLLGTVNLCRLLGLIGILLFYAGILLFLFWRRRARVFKTNELPELGFVRKKILGWMVEE